jgi:hypothetical protein
MFGHQYADGLRRCLRRLRRGPEKAQWRDPHDQPQHSPNPRDYWAKISLGKILNEPLAPLRQALIKGRLGDGDCVVGSLRHHTSVGVREVSARLARRAILLASVGRGPSSAWSSRLSRDATVVAAPRGDRPEAGVPRALAGLLGRAGQRCLGASRDTASRRGTCAARSVVPRSTGHDERPAVQCRDQQCQRVEQLVGQSCDRDYREIRATRQCGLRFGCIPWQ